jgi:hypothetical protein
MGSFGWKSPFPLRFGGGAHEAAENAYYSMTRVIGDAWTSDTDSVADAENVAAARLFMHVSRGIERYRYQADLGLCTNMLERWETFLCVVPDDGASLHERRLAVKSRVGVYYSARTVDLSRLAQSSFPGWSIDLHFNDADSAVSYWPGGSTHPDFTWYSTICHICVEYTRPTWAPDATVDRRRAACIAALDDYAPAWCTYELSETQGYGDNAGLFGFFLNQPNIGVSVLRY